MADDYTLTFYTHPMSRGRIARWMLEEVGARYDTVLMELGRKITDPAFLDLNPMGKVPVIVHDGVVVTECAAICAYLADAFPAAGLAPPRAKRGPYYRWLLFGAGCLDPAAINQGLGVEIAPEQEGMVGYRTFAATLDTLEWQLAKSPHIAGEAFTAADVYIAAQLGWGLQFGFIKDRPTIADYVDRMYARGAHEQAVALDDALAATLAG
ncbi:MAG: glutathione S-transferase family protein [Gammaproteobacteria bacterium]|nr:glutathione S-transferase family protein [Gammaproteobacteria bacterium]